jgi:hypothetical protein
MQFHFSYDILCLDGYYFIHVCVIARVTSRFYSLSVLVRFSGLVSQSSGFVVRGPTVAMFGTRDAPRTPGKHVKLAVSYIGSYWPRR